jgi:hypothetical protein
LSKPSKPKWEFTSRFRARAFGWRSSKLACQRVKEAVSEIATVARKDPMLGAEGAIRFISKLSPALEEVDSSSGALGTTVNHALDSLIPLIIQAPADPATRDAWLERLWEAFMADEIPYVEALEDRWGELCASPEVASRWADELSPGLRECWSDTSPVFRYFKGATVCLSALLVAGRHQELLDLLALYKHSFWSYRRYGVKALAAMGRKGEAIKYARESLGLNDHPQAVAEACEEILLSSGMREEAYRQYAIMANRKTTHVATFKAIAKKYPEQKSEAILRDLAASTPGEEGKWFAAAKDAGLLDVALDLARRSGVDPRTLNRAARDFAEKEPRFALGVAMASIEWMALGYGYEITHGDVLMAYDEGLNAAQLLGVEGEMKQAVSSIIGKMGPGGTFVRRALDYRLNR